MSAKLIGKMVAIRTAAQALAPLADALAAERIGTGDAQGLVGEQTRLVRAVRELMVAAEETTAQAMALAAQPQARP